MIATMQDWSMLLTRVIDHGAREHGQQEVVTRWADGRLTRMTYADIRHQSVRLAEALGVMGIQPGERVGVMAMNHAHQLSAWYGIVGAGAVIHTINPRLFADQLAYIVTHAEDRVLFYDAAFAPLVAALKDRWPGVERYVCLDNGEYEALLADHPGIAPWTTVDERAPALLCYTSGTTGDPKGVLYTHRSNMLHLLSGLQPAVFDYGPQSVVLPIVPLFHANGWGLAWTCPAVGVKLVMSAVNDAQVLCDLMTSEGVTDTGGVPTVFMAMFQHIDSTGGAFPPTLKRAVIGGSAPPPAMVSRLLSAGIDPAHAWGMTETSPIGTTSYRPANWDTMSEEERVTSKVRQGHPPFGVEMRCMDLDDPARELPRDGRTPGALQVRGPWVVKRYFKAEVDCVDANGWFATGDVAVIHPDGSLQLTDRTKDLIKSGGEWISSVELENAAMGHPAVAEAAAIGVPHPNWGERPILVVVQKPGQSLGEQDLRDFLKGKVASWWLPDAVHFVEEIPHTATGKVSKMALRERYAG
jgi:acyl-CoA synthetase (AMP-forming)/AMP-acid ligase II